MSRFAAAAIIILLSACGKPEKVPAKEAYAVYCGSCHLAPKIDELPKSLWSENVLPDMAARLGIATPGYDPYANLSYEERITVFKSGIYPTAPTLDASLYQSITDYILSQAPDSLASLPQIPYSSLENYRLRSIRYPETRLPSFSYLKIRNSSIEVGDLNGNFGVYTLDQEQWQFPYRFDSPVVDFEQKDTLAWALVVGILDPSERASGKLVEIVHQEQKVLKDSLHRPVDLNLTEEEEGYRFHIAEFGHLTGRLSELTRHNEALTYNTLVATAGAIHSQDVDINGDGRKEKVVLFAQGDERLMAIKEKADGTTAYETLLRFSPISGVSWFEAADIDGDGDMDLVTAHGDNADNTYIHKPYHGIRIHANDGNGQFTPVYNHPMHGATRVAVIDWDLDGDPDLAAIAAFPDYERDPLPSFVLLENDGSATGDWIPHQVPDMNTGRWFLMDSGDVDGDGDEDIVLGVFNYHITPVPQSYLEVWESAEVALLILENTIHDN